MAETPMNRYGVARDINPDAGTHAISNDPAERGAAEAATRQSWREFPYYPRRYGERGWRFSLSDSGWLATLSDSSDSEAFQQTQWLARLLVARGMPQFLLERHLFHLHAALMHALPLEVKRYERLQRCAQKLREMRTARLTEERFTALARDFDLQVRACETRVPNFGAVLVGAVVDEDSGAGSAANLLGWVEDGARFDAAWRSAVRDTVSQVRRQLAAVSA
jgi:hypothetical protein